MPNKAYWNLVEDIMNVTSAVCKPAMNENDNEEVATLLEDIHARKDNALNTPSAEITLAGLATEFVQVFGETCENYRKAESAEERQMIMDEVQDVTQDVFSCITNEFAEAFGEISKRFKEIAAEEDEFLEEIEEQKEWQK